jgi:hypothetical protein
MPKLGTFLLGKRKAHEPLASDFKVTQNDAITEGDN